MAGEKLEPWPEICEAYNNFKQFLEELVSIHMGPLNPLYGEVCGIKLYPRGCFSQKGHPHKSPMEWLKGAITNAWGIWEAYVKSILEEAHSLLMKQKHGTEPSTSCEREKDRFTKRMKSLVKRFDHLDGIDNIFCKFFKTSPDGGPKNLSVRVVSGRCGPVSYSFRLRPGPAKDKDKDIVTVTINGKNAAALNHILVLYYGVRNMFAHQQPARYTDGKTPNVVSSGPLKSVPKEAKDFGINILAAEKLVAIRERVEEFCSVAWINFFIVLNMVKFLRSVGRNLLKAISEWFHDEYKIAVWNCVHFSKPKKPPSSKYQPRYTCIICEDLVNDVTEDSIFCDGSCQGLIHRGCAGLSKAKYAKIHKPDGEFFCSRCQLESHYESVVTTAANEIRQLKAQISSPVPASSQPSVSLSPTESYDSMTAEDNTHATSRPTGQADFKNPPKEPIPPDRLDMILDMLDTVTRSRGLDSIRQSNRVDMFDNQMPGPSHAGNKRPVELQKAEHAWKRASEVTSSLGEDEKTTAELYRKFQSILDKLTPQKFQKLAEQAKELAEKMDSQERMSGCAEKIVVMALKGPIFSVSYAKLCSVLAPYKVQVIQVVGEENQTKHKSFRALLLTKCQQEFEKDKNDGEVLEKLKAAVEAADNKEERTKKQAEYELVKFKSRHRFLGNIIRFIGELFKFKLLSEVIIHECIQRLLSSLSDEDSLECFAKLMTTTGKELDHEKGRKLMKRYFTRVDQIIEVNRVGLRVKFILHDVVDLKKNDWIPRTLVAANMPTAIDKLREQHQEQAKEMKRSLANTQPPRRMPQGGDRQRREEWNPDHCSPPPLRKLVAANMPTTIDKLHEHYQELAEEMNRSLNTQPPRRMPQGGDRQRREKWNPDHRRPQPPQPPQVLEKERLIRLNLSDNDPPQGRRLGGGAVWGKPASKPTGKKSSRAVSNAMSKEQEEKKAENVYNELCSNLDYKEACLCVSEMRSPGNLHKLVFSVLNVSMEKLAKDRNIASVFLMHLLRDDLLSQESLMRGLNELLEFAEDLECDLPKFWDYVAEVLAHPVASGALALIELTKTPDSVLQSGKVGKLVAKTLQMCTQLESFSQNVVAKVWSDSGLNWTSHFRVEPDEVKYLIEDNKLEFLSHSSPPLIQVSSGSSQVDRQQDLVLALEQRFGSISDTNEDVMSYIKKHHNDQERCTPSFVFTLSCAIGNASIRGSGDAAIYNLEVFTRRCKILQPLLDCKEELQEEVIYGLQCSIHKKQHPKGVLDQMFTVLYENDVVVEDVFLRWFEKGRDEEGRGVALMSVDPFISWLKSDSEDQP